MDKNTITGLILIAIVVIGFSFFSRPNKQQQMAQQKFNDSIARIQEQQAKAKKATTDTTIATVAKVDSSSAFCKYANKVDSSIVLQNSKVRITLSSKGGMITEALLKTYKSQDRKSPVVLFSKKDVSLNFNFYNHSNVVRTNDLNFSIVNPTDSSVTMRINASADQKSHIDFVYKLHPESYLVDLSIQAVGMDTLLSQNMRSMGIEWQEHVRQQELGFTYENRLSTLTYRTNESSDNLSAGGEVEKEIATPVNWIAFKSQFFSSVFIADQMFNKRRYRVSQRLFFRNGYEVRPFWQRADHDAFLFGTKPLSHASSSEYGTNYQMASRRFSLSRMASCETNQSMVHSQCIRLAT
jgi:YidC/Oxa1 family membrane protein insertase